MFLSPDYCAKRIFVSWHRKKGANIPKSNQAKTALLIDSKMSKDEITHTNKKCNTYKSIPYTLCLSKIGSRLQQAWHGVTGGRPTRCSQAEQYM